MSQGYLWIFQLNASFCIHHCDGIDVELNFTRNTNLLNFHTNASIFVKISMVKRLLWSSLLLHFFLRISFWIFALDVHWVEQIFEIPIRESILFASAQFFNNFFLANLLRFNEFVHALHALCVSILHRNNVRSVSLILEMPSFIIFELQFWRILIMCSFWTK